MYSHSIFASVLVFFVECLKTDLTPCPLSFLLPLHSLRMEPPPYIYFFSPFTRVLPESTMLQPPQPAAGPHLSMNIKIMYIALTTRAPVFYCLNNTHGTDCDLFLAHIAAGLATLCKSPVLDRKKKQKISPTGTLEESYALQCALQ